MQVLVLAAGLISPGFSGEDSLETNGSGGQFAEGVRRMMFGKSSKIALLEKVHCSEISRGGNSTRLLGSPTKLRSLQGNGWRPPARAASSYL